MNWSILILALVTLQRLAELVLARRNTKALLARGGHEVEAGHYPLIVAVHLLWLGFLWWLAPGKPVHWGMILLFALLQAGRLWVLWALGRRWTTRIVVMPGETLIARGPYRFVRHPNYLIVAGEIVVLPLAFGLWEAALVFSLLNAAVLFVRIRAEERALREAACS